MGVVTVMLRVSRTGTSTTCRPSGVIEIVALAVSVNVAGIALSASAARSPIGSRPANSVSWAPVTVDGTVPGAVPGVIGSDRYCAAEMPPTRCVPTGVTAAVPDSTTSPAATVIDNRPSPARVTVAVPSTVRAGTTAPVRPQRLRDRHLDRTVTDPPDEADGAVTARTTAMIPAAIPTPVSSRPVATRDSWRFGGQSTTSIIGTA